MNDKTSFSAPTKNKTSNFSVTLSLLAALFFFLVSGYLSYQNLRTLDRNSDLVVHTHEVIKSLDSIMLLMKDAETGQRGYLITGDEKYLEPYTTALATLDKKITDVERLIVDNAAQESRLAQVKTDVAGKILELKETVELRRAKGFDEARNVVITDRGKGKMDAIRDQTNEMKEIEQGLRIKRLAEMEAAYGIALISSILTGLIGIMLSLIVYNLLKRAAKLREKQLWVQTGGLGLSSAMLGDPKIELLGEKILQFLTSYFDAHAGAFFVKNGVGFRRVAAYGINSSDKMVERFDINDGLLGQAAKDNRTFIVKDVPENYLTIGSSMGSDKPRHLLISPASQDGAVNAVFELGFLSPIPEQAILLLEQLSDSIGLAVRSANYRSNLQNLLEETQRQAEELQAQSEELRVSNEELEEQSRALKESQTRLEQQQAELEQTNAQLEEQAQLLETQKDDLSRSKNAVQLKAQELERSSRYKSDFLANMSHELRTPLNSSLILAKLLADNPDENLSDEQVKYAQTIQSSGNDLLNIINDILDLSKIEAGHMEIRPEQVPFTRLIRDIERTFDPVAKQKNLTFSSAISKNCPDIIYTDTQRLEQILKNLLSNAIKFTESGKVELSINLANKSEVSFAVTDTGIGISAEQQQAIFDAFRQADGTISRKYGGTGLGLSISRELTRLLGGTISLVSEAGKGSTFTVTIPIEYDASLIQGSTETPPSKLYYDRVESFLPEPVVTFKSEPDTVKTSQIVNDDREKLNGKKRVILVVEDDKTFCQILHQLVNDLDFQCLIAHTAEDALILAREYIPSAVVLDVGLPDNSGLSVLDRLKRDPSTRHIPVHIISANDHAQTALSLGAIGYMIKPVKLEDVKNVLKQLESKLEQRMRRVLIVEDDEVQRNSVGKLLGSHDVETVGVGTAAECLKLLKENTFDCMVLDLSLPDASGYSLLETLSREEAYSFPPVIVYTGHSLSNDDEQKLRRYSKSIIIKGAKSPERLLDEVTLFLHQVVSELPPEQQKMLKKARNRDAVLEGRRILVVEDDVRNVYSLTNILEPRGAIVQIARNGLEALEALSKAQLDPSSNIDLVLMDVMMPEMDGLTATREIRKNTSWKKLPIIMLTAKAMRDDQERCLDSGANDYMAKPLDVEKLLSLVRVWMPR